MSYRETCSYCIEKDKTISELQSKLKTKPKYKYKKILSLFAIVVPGFIIGALMYQKVSSEIKENNKAAEEYALKKKKCIESKSCDTPFLAKEYMKFQYPDREEDARYMCLGNCCEIIIESGAFSSFLTKQEQIACTGSWCTNVGSCVEYWKKY